jgi:hypothetical protein
MAVIIVMLHYTWPLICFFCNFFLLFFCSLLLEFISQIFLCPGLVFYFSHLPLLSIFFIFLFCFLEDFFWTFEFFISLYFSTQKSLFVPRYSFFFLNKVMLFFLGMIPDLLSFLLPAFCPQVSVRLFNLLLLLDSLQMSNTPWIFLFGC